MTTATVRLTITLDVSEATLERAIGALMEWPTSNAGPGNLIHHLVEGNDEMRGPGGPVRKAFIDAVMQARPDIVKDYARLKELEEYCNKWHLYQISGEKKLEIHELWQAREYIAIEAKYKSRSQKTWKEGLGEIDKEIASRTART